MATIRVGSAVGDHNKGVRLFAVLSPSPAVDREDFVFNEEVVTFNFTDGAKYIGQRAVCKRGIPCLHQLIGVADQRQADQARARQI